jgi:hypothetical protein
MFSKAPSYTAFSMHSIVYPMIVLGVITAPQDEGIPAFPEDPIALRDAHDDMRTIETLTCYSPRLLMILSGLRFVNRNPSRFPSDDFNVPEMISSSVRWTQLH